jgi:2-dehydro-3-deoxygluconokinase
MMYDIVGVGEAMLRLWVPAGRRLEDATRLGISIGGSEANVAVAAARMGASTAWISALPDNALGRRAAREIATHGVDVSRVRWTDGARMGTYFAELSVPPRSPAVIYDRAGSAASMLDASSIDWDVIDSARIVHLSGITPALSPSCLELSHDIVARRRAAAAPVSFDVNYRSKLWSPEECCAAIEPLAADADLLIVTVEDARDVFGVAGEASDVAEALAASIATGAVVVTDGAAGASWTSGGAERGSLPGYEDAVTVDRIGAGDAFAAGVLLGLLEGDLGAGVARGLAMAALSLGIYGDLFTASPDDVNRMLEHTGRELHR